MTTIVIWDELDTHIQYFVSPEDLSRFDGVYINEDYGDLEDELNDIVYDEEGEVKVTLLEKFPVEVFTAETGVKVIVAGHIP